MASKTRRKFSAFLPAAACHTELYDQLVQYAAGKGISKADAIRLAVEFFLNRDTQKMGKQPRD